MTIERGQEWGSEVDVPSGPWSRGGELELAQYLNDGARGNFELSGGDLHRVIGAPPAVAGSGRCRRLPVDVLNVQTIDSRGQSGACFGSSVVVCRQWYLGGVLRGRLLIVSNLGEFKHRRFAARSHPNDGRVEQLDASRAALRERVLAWSRARAGTFSPSENVTIRQTDSLTVEVTPRETLFIDGVKQKSLRRVSITVVPDGAVVHVGLP